MLLNDVDFDGGEREICRDCADKIGGGNNKEKVKKVGEGRDTPSGAFWCYLTHWRDSQVFPDNEAAFSSKRK